MKKLFCVLALMATGSAHAVLFHAWTYNATIAFNGYNGSETLTNFPVLVQLGTNISGYLPSQSLCALTNGGDVRFTDITGSTELNYETELWSTSTATNSIFWVQVPALSNGTQIIAYWGYATNSPAYTTNGATWSSSFRGVWHFGEQATAGQTTATHFDSTANQINGAQHYNYTTPGIVGNAQKLNQTASYIKVPYSSKINVGGTFTFSGWVRDDSPTVTLWWRILSRKNSYTDLGGWELGVSQNDNNMLYWIDSSAGGGPTIPQFFPNLSSHNWYYVAIVANGTNGKMYRDGMMITNATITAITDNGLAMAFGDGVIPGNSWIGAFDEFRYQTNAVSSDWISAAYLNMASNTTFQTYGTASKVARGTVFLFH
jgi:hypothetical protein